MGGRDPRDMDRRDGGPMRGGHDVDYRRQSDYGRGGGDPRDRRSGGGGGGPPG